MPRLRRPTRAPAVGGPLSLARALSKFGVCSRKEAERWIAAGRVAIDGRTVLWPQRRLDPRRSRVTVDGRRVDDLRAPVVLILNKPVGFITTRADPGGRPTVYDLLDDAKAWVFPVGRLDRDSSGMLVLTNDHRLGQRLTDPGHAVPKTYHVLVKGIPSPDVLRTLREGVALPDGAVTRPARVRALGTDRGLRTWLEVVLGEGRNRQIRRMCAAVGHDVEQLVRVQVGGLALGELPSGSWRRLTAREVELLQEAGPS